MFTSRAEYRLQLREDNADLRLTERGRELNLVDDARWAAFCEKRDAIAQETARLKSFWAAPGNALATQVETTLGVVVSRETSAYDLLRRPELDYAQLTLVPALGPAVTDAKVAEQVEIQAKYSGYLDRQADEIERQRRSEATLIPTDFDYAVVSGLSAEVRAKLEKIRPETVGQAMRISGVTPAAISLLLVYLKRWRGARPATGAA